MHAENIVVDYEPLCIEKQKNGYATARSFCRVRRPAAPKMQRSNAAARLIHPS